MTGELGIWVWPIKESYDFPPKAAVTDPKTIETRAREGQYSVSDRKNLPIIATTSANMWPVANRFIPAW